MVAEYICLLSRTLWTDCILHNLSQVPISELFHWWLRMSLTLLYNIVHTVFQQINRDYVIKLNQLLETIV